METIEKVPLQEQTKQEIVQENAEKCKNLNLSQEKTLILTNESLNADQLIMLMQCEEQRNHTSDHLLFMSTQSWSVISALSVYFAKGGTLETAQEIISRKLSEIQTILLLEKQK